MSIVSETSATAGRGSVDLIHVTKRYGETIAVAALSLAVESGEFLTLLGPSGCGKSTTLRLIGGFERPEVGDVRIGGVSMAGWAPHRRHVNTVFQNYALFPHMTVWENVGFGLEMASVPGEERKRRVGAALAMVRLPDVAGRAPSALSGGQQQRVALARALVNRPAVVLLDEPLGALDLKLRREMQSELKTLNRETGATFIYVTHDQDEALSMSDRIAVMDDGRIRQVGSPFEIYERPRSRFVADFVGESNFLVGVLREQDGGVARVAVDGVGVVGATIPEGVTPTCGDRVTVAVRPEHARLTETDSDGDVVNRLEGRVVEFRYAGAHTRIVMALANGGLMTAQRPADAADSRLVAGGSRVVMAFAVERASVLID